MNYPKTISVLKTMTGTKSLQDQLSNATWDDAQAVLVKLSPDSKAYQTLEQECEDTKPQDVQMDDDEVRLRIPRRWSLKPRWTDKS